MCGVGIRSGEIAPSRCDMAMYEFLQQLSPSDHALVILSIGVLVAIFTEIFMRRVALTFVQRTATPVDDAAVHILRHPIAATVLIMSGGHAMQVANLPPIITETGISLLETVLIVVWARVFLKAGQAFLELAARTDGATPVHLHPRSIPTFDFGIKLGVYAGASYLALTAWGINPTAMAASLGVVGLAVGFAAQESLGNLFAGLLIIADSPYQIGDTLQLDNGVRGEVVDIGIRSTRLVTNDNVEIIVPNSIMANTQVINETGGPARPRRIDVPIGVAYGTELEHVTRVILDALADIQGLVDVPPATPPQVLLTGFGDSSVDLTIMVWVAEPRHDLMARHRINVAIYNALNAANIEIPFPKRDITILANPGSLPPS